MKTIDWTSQQNTPGRRVTITTSVNLTKEDVTEALASNGIFIDGTLYKVPRRLLLIIQANQGYGLRLITFELETG